MIPLPHIHTRKGRVYEVMESPTWAKKHATGMFFAVTSFGPVFRIPTKIKNPATTNVVTG